MKYKRLGRSGVSVSRICLGAMSYGSNSWAEWILDEKVAKQHFSFALEQGINFFDTADVYSNGESEKITGKLLNEMVDDREDVVIATKFFLGTHNQKPNRWGASKRHIIAACDASLKRLNVDYIDLYQIHRFDYKVPIEETVDALDYLVNCGKVRYIGASSMFAWQFLKYLNSSDNRFKTRFISMQNHYNLLYREEEREMIPLCKEESVGIIPWSPLARGALARSGDTTRKTTDRYQEWTDVVDNKQVIDANLAVAKEHGVTPAQSALAWMLSKDYITAPIIGATKLKHIEDAVKATDLKLSDENIKSMEQHYKPVQVIGAL